MLHFIFTDSGFWLLASGFFPSKRRFKRMRRMSDLRIAPFGPDDGNHVESRRRLGNSVARQIRLCRLGELMLLGGIDLVFGGRLVIGARLDLDEDQNFSIAGDNVDLADVAAEISHNDFVSQVPQELGGHVLAAIAKGVALVGWFEKALEPTRHGGRLSKRRTGFQGMSRVARPGGVFASSNRALRRAQDGPFDAAQDGPGPPGSSCRGSQFRLGRSAARRRLFLLDLSLLGKAD